jgi:cellulose synthase/poly-beta-1,6-N-acetylglucosamine synthase-like glycosyltransferase
MVAFLSFLLMALTCLVAVPVVVFLVEIIASIAIPEQRHSIPLVNAPRPRVAVLVPAHNEGNGLVPTLADIRGQMRSSDRLLVVVDNCTDDTHAVAVAAGAEVVDRNDPDRKGKGYALAWGVSHLGEDPPDVVVIVDADCRLADGVIDRLAATCAATHRPVQALYIMLAPDGSPINLRVAEFAWRVKNWVRPRGLGALGLPCQLMGTGMGFPWDVIRSVDLASGSIVEDMKLGLDLAMAGHFPLFSPSLGVTSNFPTSVEGIQNQRLRWERGHIGMITAAPRLILAAIARLNLPLLVLALDVAVPPLSLLGVLVAGMLIVDSLAALSGLYSTALVISFMNFAGLLVGVIFCWLKYGRDILPVSATLQVLSYVIGKLPMYRTIVSHKSRTQWIRTDRRNF